MKRPKVAEFMTRDVVTVGTGTTFQEVVELLAKHRISGMPVVDAGQVVGVVSEADLLPKEAAKPLPTEFGSASRRRSLFRSRRRRAEDARAEGGTAGDVMSTPPVTIDADTTVIQAARLMTRRGLKRLPVVSRDGALSGVVSRADLLRVFLKPDEAIGDEVVNEVIMRSLWEEPKNVRVEVDDGVVTLRGRLERASLLPIAEDLTAAIDGVDGVVGVRNELTFELDDTTREIENHPH